MQISYKNIKFLLTSIQLFHLFHESKLANSNNVIPKKKSQFIPDSQKYFKKNNSYRINNNAPVALRHFDGFDRKLTSTILTKYGH